MINLKPLQKEHCKQIRLWAVLPKFREYFRYHPPLWMWDNDEVVFNLMAPQTTVIFDDDTMIGLISLGKDDPRVRTIELGILVTDVRDFRGDDAETATRMILEYYFDYRGYQRITSLVLAHRTKLIERMCKILGFKVDGTLRRNTFFDGQFHDEVVLSILKEEYLRKA